MFAGNQIQIVNKWIWRVDLRRSNAISLVNWFSSQISSNVIADCFSRNYPLSLAAEIEFLEFVKIRAIRNNTLFTVYNSSKTTFWLIQMGFVTRKLQLVSPKAKITRKFCHNTKMIHFKRPIKQLELSWSASAKSKLLVSLSKYLLFRNKAELLFSSSDVKCIHCCFPRKPAITHYSHSELSRVNVDFTNEVCEKTSKYHIYSKIHTTPICQFDQTVAFRAAQKRDFRFSVIDGK